VHHAVYARSVPALVEDLARELADRLGTWSLDDFRREWGSRQVTAAFSPDRRFNFGETDPVYGRVCAQPDRQRILFSEYLATVAHEHEEDTEFVSIQQSPSRSFEEFGLPDLPPGLEELVRTTLNARNLWVSTPGKLSVLHYDWQDSVLLQLSGSKRFTVIDPARMQTAYPCVQRLKRWQRLSRGEFRGVVEDREIDNFPLLNISHPDLERHPLFKESHSFTIEVPAGSALLLPAYWYHQVESFAEPGKLNVAINYWYQGHSLATRLYRTMRENLFINCTEPAPPGEPHPCR